jgi:hypothetical protein
MAAPEIPPSLSGTLAEEIAVIACIYAPPDFKVELSKRCLTLMRSGDGLRIMVELPERYPGGDKKPMVTISGATGLPRAKAAAVNAELVGFTDTMHAEGECILELVQAAMDSVDAAIGALPSPGVCGVSEAPFRPVSHIKRVWVWFHHIKSERKKRDIAAWAQDLGVWSLCKPGFPGCLVVEGLRAGVECYIARLKALPWQAMVVRHEEEQELSSGEDVEEAVLLRSPAARAALAEAGLATPDPKPCAIMLPEDAMGVFAAVMGGCGRLDVFKAALLRL